MKTVQTTPHAVHSKVSPKVIIWDIDGTLVDTAPPFIKSLISKLQIKTSLNSDTDSRPFSDPNIQERLQEEFDLNSEQARRMIEEFRQNYKEHSVYRATLYPKIRCVMDAIKLMGYTQAVVTNIRQCDSAFHVCENHAIDQFCDHFIGSDWSGKEKRANHNLLIGNLLIRGDWLGKKRKANIIEEFLEHLHTRDAIMIGDTDVDKHAAEEVGVRFIGVNYGYGFRNVPGYANSPKEIRNCIEHVNH